MAEQVVSLPDASRGRLALTFYGFDPTDLAESEHLEQAPPSASAANQSRVALPVVSLRDLFELAPARRLGTHSCR